MNFRASNKPAGFTLLELMIAIAILGTLAGIAAPFFSAYVDRAKVARAIVEIRMLEKEILFFYDENGRLPTNLGEIGLGGIKDPYGNPYQYLPAPPEEKGKGKAGNAGIAAKMRKDHNLVPVNTDFDLYSMGKDGESKAPFTAKASRDDIARANNGQFIGLVSAY